jgi:transcriptional regulator with XRE-family HTH domain/tetratricopeptide (TPR) repeat protein
MVETVTVETFGEAVRRLRAEHGGMSLRQLAKLAALDPGHLSRIESGRRPPSRQIAAALDQALGACGALVGLASDVPLDLPPLAVDGWGRPDAEALASALVAEQPTPDNALRLAHEWLVTEPPQLYEMRAGRRVGARVVDQVEQRVQQLRHLDDHVGGLDTYEMVTGELAATLTLLREAAYIETVGRRLLVAAGELAQLAGWVTADAGRHAEATRLYLTGVRAGHAAGDRPGAASNLSSLAYLVANTGDPRQAVLMAASAVRGAEHEATPAARALLLERLAWAQAKAAAPVPTERALGQVDDVFADARPDEGPAWTYWLDREEIAIMAGRCWTQLHRPLRAVPILEEATRRYGEDTARESALYLTWLAEAYLQANEIERAADVAIRALELAPRARSERTMVRLDELRALFGPYRGVPAVDALDDAFRAVPPTVPRV